MSPPLPDHEGRTRSSAEGGAEVIDRTQTLAPRSDTPEPPELEPDSPIPIDDPERYEAICEHARGGLGRVVRAVDRRLGRTVAVKELLRHDKSASDETRFLREASITARLEHPGIVPVHEAGRWPNGDPYYVMKLVEGRTLKELIAGRSTLRDRMHLLPHVIAVADAVGYAHSQGVIHRDLKPSNIIVGEFGETIVVDWGLARDRKAELPEPDPEMIAASAAGPTTISGKVVGTPGYMAPEQARGELVDERADVYAIGAMLYELLTGAAPHADTTPQAMLDRVIAGPPEPLGRRVPQAPVELVTLVGMAMARIASERYPNASALAEDLRRFQTGKLVSAHSYTAWSLVRKKLAQHRGVVAVAVASAIALAAIGVGSFRRVVAERNIAQQNGLRADEARGQSEKRQRELVLLQAETSLRKDPTATLAWLKAYAIDDTDRAHVQDIIDEAIALGVARHVFRPGTWVLDAVFTPDGKRVVAAIHDATLRVYDLETGRETIVGRTGSAAELVVMSHGGDFAITGGMLGEVIVWPLGGGEPRVLADEGRTVQAIDLANDGSRVLVRRETGAPEILRLDGGPAVRLGPATVLRTSVANADWTRVVISTSPNQLAAVAGDELRPLAQTARAIARFVVSPHGDHVIVHDGAVLWQVAFAGGPLEKLVDYDGRIAQVVWSPDGSTLAIAGERHDVVLVDLEHRTARELRGHTDQTYTVQWTRDGRRLLSASDDGTARVWTVSDATAVVLRGHDDDVYRAWFSADERQVVTASLDGSVRVWELEPTSGSRMFVEGRSIDQLSITGDRALVTTKAEVSRWNLISGHREPVFAWGGLGIGLPSPSGERVLVLAPDWSIEVRGPAGHGHTMTLRGHRTRIAHVEFSRDSQLVYTSSYDGTLRRWDLETGECRTLIEGSEPVTRFAVAGDGRIVAQVGDAAVLLAPDGRAIELGQGDRWCFAAAEFEPVRDRLLLRRCDQGMAMLDGRRLIELPTGSHVLRTAVSADGSRIAGAMGDRTVRLWDAETGRVLGVLRGHSDLVMDVAFSPDGTMLASASYDKTVRIWELATERHRVLRGHQLSVNRVVWRDGRHLVTGSRDGTLRLWDLPAMQLPSVRELGVQLARATTARIDGDRPSS
jgi:eukaryotic-like serine/threonine-protein kinase